MGTTDETGVRRLGAKGKALGAEPVDCPGSGGCHRAATGNIAIFAGCERATFERMLPTLTTMGSRILHTGDFKLDMAPGVGEPFDEDMFTAIGKAGVHALVCDSTNATVAGHSISEAALHQGLLEAVRAAPGRVATPSPRLRSATREFAPKPSPPAKTGALARTFITAPPTSTPTMSVEV